MTKVLGISFGTKNGNNDCVCKEVLKGAQEAGCEVEFIRATLDMTFVAEREGERVVGIPVLFMILGIFLWGATIWLLIIGLFFGFKYHIEGANPFTVDVNDAMDKVADAAENLKRDFTKDE